MFQKSILDRVMFFFEDDRADFCNTAVVILSHSRQFFHSSLIPNYAAGTDTFSLRDDTFDLMKLFLLSETLQFVPRLVFHEESVVKRSQVERFITQLINQTRYFGRSLQILESIHMTKELLEIVCKNCVALETLILRAVSGLRDDQLHLLHHAPSLRNLDFSYGWVTCESLLSIQNNNNSKNNKKPDDSNKKAADATASSNPLALRFANRMESLTLCSVFCLSTCNKSFLAVFSRLVNLKKLDFADCQKINSKNLNHIKSLINLEDLNLRNCEGIDDLSPLSGLVHLRRLDLGGKMLGVKPNDKQKGLRNLRDLSTLQELTLGQLNISSPYGDDGDGDGDGAQCQIAVPLFFESEEEETYFENMFSKDDDKETNRSNSNSLPKEYPEQFYCSKGIFVHDYGGDWLEQADPCVTPEQTRQVIVNPIFEFKNVSVNSSPLARSLRSLKFESVGFYSPLRPVEFLAMHLTIGRCGSLRELSFEGVDFPLPSLFVLSLFTKSLRRLSVEGNHFYDEDVDAMRDHLWRLDHLEVAEINTVSSK